MEKANLVNMDNILLTIQDCLYEDLREHLPFRPKGREMLPQGNYPTRKEGVYRVKAIYQMNSLFKRYIFRGEGASLEEKAIQAFHDLQARIATPITPGPATLRILREARKIVTKILGDYDVQETVEHLKFSSNAVVGSGRNKGYPDLRLQPGITGQAGHIAWFSKHVLPNDILLRELISKMKSVSTADLLTVPKAYDKLRTICPDTGIGSAYSSALGTQIKRRMKIHAKINLNRLSEKHRRLAKRSSVTLQYVTLDVKSGSDCFGTDVVNRLVNYKWLGPLRRGRISVVKASNGDKIKLASFMAMGIGFTFPLESLLFYAILEAIRVELRLPGLVSVFGDDCIYPIEMHKHAVHVFKELRILPNLDKTFALQTFRESCGGDYCLGIDVRPFMYEGDGNSTTSPTQDIAELYKLLNGFLERWAPEEIPSTIRYLEGLLLACHEHSHDKFTIMQVPQDFPAYAGRRSSKVLPPPYEQPIWDASEMRYRFRCMGVQKAERPIKDERAYYWLKLAGALVVDEYDPYSGYTEPIFMAFVRHYDGTIKAVNKYEKPESRLTLKVKTLKRRRGKDVSVWITASWKNLQKILKRGGAPDVLSFGVERKRMNSYRLGIS